jgi:hypothetical protein
MGAHILGNLPEYYKKQMAPLVRQFLDGSLLKNSFKSQNIERDFYNLVFLIDRTRGRSSVRNILFS